MSQHLRAVPNGNQPARQDGLVRGPAWMLDPARHCNPEWGVDPELFHSPEPADQSEAKALCADCPFRIQCRDWGRKYGLQFGIWGGENVSAQAKKRAKQRHARSRPHDPAIKAMWEQGMSDHQIAKELGVWPGSVGKARGRMGLAAHPNRYVPPSDHVKRGPGGRFVSKEAA